MYIIEFLSMIYLFIYNLIGRLKIQNFNENEGAVCMTLVMNKFLQLKNLKPLTRKFLKRSISNSKQMCDFDDKPFGECASEFKEDLSQNEEDEKMDEIENKCHEMVLKLIIKLIQEPIGGKKKIDFKEKALEIILKQMQLSLNNETMLFIYFQIIVSTVTSSAADPTHVIEDQLCYDLLYKRNHSFERKSSLHDIVHIKDERNPIIQIIIKQNWISFLISALLKSYNYLFHDRETRHSSRSLIEERDAYRKQMRSRDMREQRLIIQENCRTISQNFIFYLHSYPCVVEYTLKNQEIFNSFRDIFQMIGKNSSLTEFMFAFIEKMLVILHFIYI